MGGRTTHTCAKVLLILTALFLISCRFDSYEEIASDYKLRIENKNSKYLEYFGDEKVDSIVPMFVDEVSYKSPLINGLGEVYDNGGEISHFVKFSINTNSKIVTLKSTNGGSGDLSKIWIHDQFTLQIDESE